jgi:hypothetical protein
MPTASGPLYATIPGQLGYQSVYIPTGKEILPRQNPLVLMANMAKNDVAKYLGNTNDKQKSVPLKMIVVPSAEFQFTEYDPERSRTTTLTTELGTTETTFPVASTDGFHVKDEIKIAQTGEICRIDAILNGALQVERAFSSTLTANTAFPSSLTQDTATNPDIGDTIIRLGPAMEEGSSAIYRQRKTSTRRIGHTQILRSDLIQTGTEQAQEPSDTIAEEKFDANKSQEFSELLIDHEYLAFHGKLHRASRNGEVIRTTEGFLEFISTNTIAASSLQGIGASNLFTLDALQDMVFQAQKRGGKKVYLVGNEGFRYIAKVVGDTGSLRQELDPGATKFGISPDSIYNAFGIADFVYYPLMDTAPLAHQIIAIDPDQLMLATLRNRAMSWKENTQQNDYDGRAGRWLAEMAVIPLNEKMHSRFTGFKFYTAP